MKINGIGLEKILVFAKDREATLQEMLMVTCASCYKIEGGEGSGFNCSTEEWNQLAGERESAAIRRVAGEVAAKFPGMDVLAFAWPKCTPMIIAAIVTEGAFPPPFPEEEHFSVQGTAASE
jgi:hypothetical protein